MQHTLRKADTGEFDARDLATATYGAAHGGIVVLFATLARAAEQRLGEFNAQELANTAWGFGTVMLSNEKIFTALARAAERRLDEFNVQNLVNTA